MLAPIMWNNIYKPYDDSCAFQCTDPLAGILSAFIVDVHCTGDKRKQKDCERSNENGIFQKVWELFGSVLSTTS